MSLDSLMQEFESSGGINKGKFVVIGIDKFDESDWMHGVYNDREEALRAARGQTENAMKDATDGSIATVYYAYEVFPDRWEYLGGDVWNDE